MSSDYYAGGLIAGALILPAVVAYGAGWALWQGGKFTVNMNRKLNSQIEQKKEEIEEENRRKREKALSDYNRLINSCKGLLKELYGDFELSEIENVELEKRILNDIINADLPASTEGISNFVFDSFLKLDEVSRKCRNNVRIKIPGENGSLYKSYSLADLIEDFREEILSVIITETKGRDVRAIPYETLIRTNLLNRFKELSADLKNYTDYARLCIQERSVNSGDLYWLNCNLEGIDETINKCTNNELTLDELKKCVRILKEKKENFENIMPAVERNIAKFDSLYEMYAKVSASLLKEIKNKSEFKNIDELNAELKKLNEISKRAEECAKIYRNLGEKAYLCFAWDQALRSLGYKVYSRTDVVDLSNTDVEYKVVDGKRIPCLDWYGDLSIFYSFAEKSSLQMIAHDDGKISMHVISDDKSQNTVNEVKKHCSRFEKIRELLRNDWFISIDEENISLPQDYMSVSEWRQSDVFTEYGIGENNLKSDHYRKTGLNSEKRQER